MGIGNNDCDGDIGCSFCSVVRIFQVVRSMEQVGWITFVYLILHAYAAVILGVMRLLVWLWQRGDCLNVLNESCVY